MRERVCLRWKVRTEGDFKVPARSQYARNKHTTTTTITMYSHQWTSQILCSYNIEHHARKQYLNVWSLTLRVCSLNDSAGVRTQDLQLSQQTLNNWSTVALSRHAKPIHFLVQLNELYNCKYKLLNYLK